MGQCSSVLDDFLTSDDAHFLSSVVVTKPAAVELPAVEPAVPAVELPAVELPAVELPAVELPAVELPAVELPAVELPAVELPAAELPAVELPAVELPAVELPAAELPVAQPVVEHPEPLVEQHETNEELFEAESDTKLTEEEEIERTLDSILNNKSIYDDMSLKIREPEDSMMNLFSGPLRRALWNRDI